MFNRCVTYSDSGLTREAGPRHAKLAVAELGQKAARPQTSPSGAKPNAPLDHEELEPDGQQAYHCVSARLAYLAADVHDIAFACKKSAVGQLGKQRVQTAHASETNRTIPAVRTKRCMGVPGAGRREHHDD